jgi:hypothetical protein
LFSGWSGDLSGSTNPTTITMIANKTVIATFTLLIPTTGNNPPSAPTADSPADESSFGDTDTVTLDTSTFSDQDTGDTHIVSYWEVRRADSSEVVYEAVVTSGTETDLTQHTITETLLPGLKYVWKVGYEDSNSNISWSTESTFKVGTYETESLPQIYSGTSIADFNMISFVHWPDDPASSSVFSITYDTRYQVL